MIKHLLFQNKATISDVLTITENAASVFANTVCSVLFPINTQLGFFIVINECLFNTVN